MMTALVKTAILACMVGAVSCSAANATDYYVDPVDGNDNNNGTTSTTPWKSLNKVNNLDLSPGDTINLRAGRVFVPDHPHTVLCFTKVTSNGVLTDDSGTAAQPIIVRSYGQGAKPRIEQTFNTNYNSAVVGFQGPVSNIIIDGIHMKGIKGPYNTSNGKDGLDTFSTALLSYTGGEYSTNVTIKNSEIEGGCRGLLLYRCVNYNIENNYIHDVNGANTNTHDWASLWPENHFKKGQPGFPLSKSAHPSGLDNDSGAEAIDLSSYCNNIRIASNQIANISYDSYDYGPDGTFIEVYGHDISNVEVCYNRITNAPGGTVEMGHYGGGTVNGFNFHHNLILEGATFYAIHAQGTYGLSSILNLQFNNNTFVQRLISDDLLRPWAIFDVNGEIANPNDVKVQNNIFYIQTGTKQYWNDDPAPAISAIMGNDDVFTHKNNIFRKHPGAPGMYRFNIPLDASEKADLDPGFVNRANGDYTLAASSPAVNAGLNLGYTRDLAGNPVPSGGAVDIGAFERVGTTGTPAQLAITGATAGAEQPDNWKHLAYDNNIETRWCNEGAISNGWITLDLGATRNVSKVRLMMENGHLATYPVKIEVGDGTTFTTAYTGATALGNYKAFHDVNFAAKSGRYVRISLTANNSFGHAWFSTWEIQVHGTP